MTGIFSNGNFQKLLYLGMMENICPGKQQHINKQTKHTYTYYAVNLSPVFSEFYDILSSYLNPQQESEWYFICLWLLASIQINML